MIKSLCLLLTIFCNVLVFAQEKKFLNLKRAAVAPKIDGVLDDAVWKTADEAKDFIQYRPEMGVKEEDQFRTVVKVTYDNNAIYVSAYLYDDPSKIMRQISSRDNFGQSDFLMLILNPNNDAQNNTYFVVFSSGTQADAVATSDNEDFGWNAVWDSAVKINDDGWVVEMKIPYSALRFSNEKVQTWGMQVHREFKRSRTRYTWNPIDATKGFSGLYHGELKGIKNIEPPARLSFYPFASALASSFDGTTQDEYRLGLDVKYGISENFTLDATLIPDFSQAGFDNLTLNLGPFEQTFSEQRQFFKEGVDLFNKGDLFFSRRIGNAPIEPANLDENEEFVDFPNRVKLLNAVKVSGRTKNGWGIGFFNAITEKTKATVRNNVTEETRTEVVEPLANYNILVVDKQFNQNSSISLINTNVTRDGSFRDANVTAALFNLTNKTNKFNISGETKLSNVNGQGGNVRGFSSRISLAKISGNYRYSIGHKLADTKFDINDLGLQLRNNFNDIFVNASYRIFEPTETLNNFSIDFYAHYDRLYEPSTYAGNSLGFEFYARTKKSLVDLGGSLNAQIGRQYDYFGPRTEGRFSIYKNWTDGNVWVSSDFNKPFALDLRLGFGTLFDKDRDIFNYNFRIGPRFKLNDNFLLTYTLNYDDSKGNRGYVTDVDDDIIYGQRDQKSIENSISGSYNFNSLHGLTLTFRNFWITVNYDHDLYLLLENGQHDNQTGFNVDNIGFNPNINFNTWNLDLKYAWEFAPGSQLIALYRNQLFNQDTASRDSYFKSLNTLFDQPIEHVFSLRMVYYIDYNNIKNFFKKKNS